jgi:hypothetical protein
MKRDLRRLSYIIVLLELLVLGGLSQSKPQTEATPNVA